jgi:hypothetical protein
MPGIRWTSRLLVKAPAGLPSATFRLGVAALRFEAQPLFSSIGFEPGLGAAPTSTWHILNVEEQVGAEEANPWDLCHALLAEGIGIAGAPAAEFAEPDFAQSWLAGEEGEQALALTRTCEKADTQNPDFPIGANDLWFRDAEHTQFDQALARIGGSDIAAKVRIAHFDTGYDPQHAATPARVLHLLERNFVDPDRPKDATDRSDGLFNSIGHGTGTLSILAGRSANGETPIGGAPFAEVVPVRVADRVVLFYNSAIARAFDYVHALCREPHTRIDVITMSMGGLASEAWADAVNALYDAGVFIVTAAGNNYANFPTHKIVYPARFRRVLAACGVMADSLPYADLKPMQMAGNYGPKGKMTTAMSAFTPNVPWARFGCPQIVDFDGRGTSAATPQLAAAAAMWIQQHRAAYDAYPQPWMRVEALRKSLFDGARPGETRRLGRGLLRADDALQQVPAAAAKLRRQEADSASFPILRLLTGLGLQAAPNARQRMLELEALQLSQSAEVEAVLVDAEVPPDQLSLAELSRIADALAAQSGASKALREALARPGRKHRSFMPAAESADQMKRFHLEMAINPPVATPARRHLRVYAYDPSLGLRLKTAGINEATIDLRWEKALEPGPVGEYLEVLDVDPASRCCYAPVDLNHPHLLVSDGLAPSEANPQFHQQMVYAVAMRTIEHFERALGRVALWAPRRETADGKVRDHFVRRLRVYPHGVRQANAFYSPERKALLMGYFSAPDKDAGDLLPGGTVFTSLSHDIIAHEATHALLDGLHRRFIEPTNPDVLAFHEAFADIVALFQHFTMAESVREVVAETRGDLGKNNLLAKLAVEFGQATGRSYEGLRNALGKKPSGEDYERSTEPHARGAVLVAAVFDAFIQIYRARTEDLVRIATGGSRLLPPGDLPPDLRDRLAREASKVAGHILNICIRALDYTPPVDITFGDYLRALITADSDLVPVDTYGYRVAFVAAFRDRGIYPQHVRHLSPASLLWEPPPLPPEGVRKFGAVLNRIDLGWDLDIDREAAYRHARKNAYTVWKWLMSDEVSDEDVAALGFVRLSEPEPRTLDDIEGELRPIEVHSVRPAWRVGPDGQSRSDLVVEVTQTFRPSDRPHERHRGGCTIIVDIDKGAARYFIRKRVGKAERMAAQREFAAEMMRDSLRTNYFGDEGERDEPFAILHRGY